MSIISDILSGRLFKFRIATGADLNAGTSDKLLVTPLSIKNSQLGNTIGNESVASLHFAFQRDLISRNSAFRRSELYEITPDTGNGYFYTGRSDVFTAKLFVFAKMDFGGTGEAALINVSDNIIISGSNLPFSGSTYKIFKSNEFTLLPGKAYTVAIKKTSGLTGIASLRAALVTIKIPKA